MNRSGFIDRVRSIVIRARFARSQIARNWTAVGASKCCDSSFDCVLSPQRLLTLWIARLVKTTDCEGARSASRGPSAKRKIRVPSGILGARVYRQISPFALEFLSRANAIPRTGIAWSSRQF